MSSFSLTIGGDPHMKAGRPTSKPVLYLKRNLASFFGKFIMIFQVSDLGGCSVAHLGGSANGQWE